MNYEITEEQIKELAEKFGSDNQTKLRSELTNKLKEWFPEVFEAKNGWYKENCLFNKHWLGFYEDGNLIYGIDARKEWFTSNAKIKSDTERKATDSEVEEALTNEAIKRGFVDGVTFNIVNGEREPIYIKNNSRYGLDNYGNKLLMNNWCIFENGKWATPIKTYTKEEAEKLLNAKIID